MNKAASLPDLSDIDAWVRRQQISDLVTIHGGLSGTRHFLLVDQLSALVEMWATQPGEPVEEHIPTAQAPSTMESVDIDNHTVHP